MELKSLGTIGLEAIDKHIESILNLTKKKDLAQWTENVMINNKEKSDNKLAMAHARFAAFTKSTAKHDLFSGNEIDLLSKPKTTTDKVREIIKKNGLSGGKKKCLSKNKTPKKKNPSRRLKAAPKFIDLTNLPSKSSVDKINAISTLFENDKAKGISGSVEVRKVFLQIQALSHLLDNGPKHEIEVVIYYLNKNQCYSSQFVLSFFPFALSLLFSQLQHPRG